MNLNTELITLKTDDGIKLSGAVWTPSHVSTQTAIAIFPGTGSEYYEPLFIWLGEHLAAAGITTLAMNRRDHGHNFGFFSLHDAAMDQRHGIDFLSKRGIEYVLLAGHSYGTVTVPYYISETDDQRVPGLILLAALGDMRRGSMLIMGGEDPYQAAVDEAEIKVAAGLGQDSFLLPPMVAGSLPMVHNYEIFLDKRGPNSRAVPVELIKQVGDRPLFAIRDSADPFPATLPPAQEQLEHANPNLTYRLLAEAQNKPGSPANHYFEGREDEVLRHLLTWMRKYDFLK